MSISTPSPMTPELLKRLGELQGEPAARDERHALYDQLKPMTQKDGGDLARAQGEPVTVTLHDAGEVVTFSDGRQYEAHPDGWRRVDAERASTRTTDEPRPDAVKGTSTHEADAVGDVPTTQGDPDHG